MKFKNTSNLYKESDFHIDLDKIESKVIGYLDCKFNQDRNVYNPLTITGTLVANNCGFKNKILEIQGDYSYMNKLKLWDFLDQQNGYEVDESYYLSQEQLIKISKWKAYEKPLEKIVDNTHTHIGCLTTRSFDMTSSIKLVDTSGVDASNIDNVSPTGHNSRKVYDENEDHIGTVRHNNGNSQTIRTNARIRKLTPREAYRLMGLRDNEKGI